MSLRRRIVCLLTTLSVAWTALWPLVSSAHALWANEGMPLCHQAGMQVAPDEMPMQEAAPGVPAAPKQHCPLCIMAFYAGFAPAAEVAPPQFFTTAPHRDAVSVPAPQRFAQYVPPSRAPPR